MPLQNNESPGIEMKTQVEAKQLLMPRIENVHNRNKKKRCCSNCCICFFLTIGLVFTAYGLTEIVSFSLSNSEIEWSTSSTPRPNIAQSIYVEENQRPFESCNSRIVGYYNLHSDTDLLEKQLKLLTHVIFHPFNVQSNGTLAFTGTVQRHVFEKLIERAKRLNVKIMVSISDENSKVFPTLTVERTERKKLVNSISSFIEDYDIDGVDIRWKWPKHEVQYRNFVLLCKELKQFLTQHHASRENPYIISILMSPWPKLEGYSKIQDEILAIADFLNVETNNYYGSWFSTSNHLIGPPAPLFGGHKNFGGENINHALRYYSCRMKQSNHLNVMVSFRANFWRNVIMPENLTETQWMTSEPINGTMDGGWISFKQLKREGFDLSNAFWNNDSKTPYIWEPDRRLYIAFENERSLEEKLKYAIDKNIGGITVWDINEDDDEFSLLSVVSSAKLCSGSNKTALQYSRL